ncbi:DUF4296 domain-containing protein [Chitinophaga horti]|uniref:DUF4296 domain-containing protein n=1 Tax=Chitinophaga horti TaxID=2920382 RepID=A0ABY6J1F2_9BACT|nr:DUF4296 domain-containing protein [Chitinophaga horti]UYQ93486.1 DUF4296 domain-containing protein [Chitinophaga horti]
MRRTALLLMICTIVAIACGDAGKVPKDVIGKDKMREVLTDMNIADIYGRDILESDTVPMTDSLRELRVKKYYAQVLQVHGITVKEFMDSYRWYEAHPDIYEEVLKKMLDNVTARKAYLDTLEARRQQHFTDSINKRQEFVADSIKKANPQADSLSKLKSDSTKTDSVKADSLLKARARAVIDSAARANKKRYLADTAKLRKRQDSLRKILQSGKPRVLK